MKKYVLNIDRLYAGDTSNSILVSQVDNDFPILVSNISETDDKSEFLRKWQSVYPNFGKGVSDIDNEYIIEFNLELQNNFKKDGYSELYMIDDTIEGMKPNKSSYDVEKMHMHSLNGKELGGNGNSSQLNVLFPFKKICQKSFNQNSSDISSDIDLLMEKSMNITFQGKVSYQKCVQSVGSVGNNMYIMSPQININSNEIIHSNGLTIVNGIGNQYVFPSTLTLFNGDSQYLNWFRKHDHSVSIIPNDDLHNVSPIVELKLFGSTSWELTWNGYWLPKIMGYDSSSKSYKEFDDEEDGVIRMPECDEFGILFNLYDSFVSGQSRVVMVRLPSNRYGKRLVFSSHKNIVDENITLKYRVFIGDKKIESNEHSYIKLNDIPQTLSTVDIKVEIVSEIDYRLRNSDSNYSENLKHSGVILSGFKIVDEYVDSTTDELTYGSYIDEIGINEQQKNDRFNEFWQFLATHMEKIPYQTVLETSMNNHLSNNITFRNNYSTGDMYGDAFSTKNVFDPKYDMKIENNGNSIEFDSREYIGVGDCSNQLSLFYKPMTIHIDKDSNSSITRRGSNNYDELKYQMVEVVKNINKFESSIKHKSNVFSVVVNNSNLAERPSDDDEINKVKKKLRNCVIQFVRDSCKDIIPVHTQLFDVQFK